jgi:hypothetical protein
MGKCVPIVKFSYVKFISRIWKYMLIIIHSMYCSHHVFLLISSILVHFDWIFNVFFDFTHTLWNLATTCSFVFFFNLMFFSVFNV